MSGHVVVCERCEEERILKHKPRGRKSNMCKKCANYLQLRTHGESGTRIYSIYNGICKRVSELNDTASEYYSDRGIKNNFRDFEHFKEWSLANGYDDSLSIDRINNDGDYEPNNCRWENSIVQSRNTRKIYKHNTSGYRGVTMTKPKNENRKIRWVAQIHLNNKRKYIGSFDSAKEAALAYDNYVIENKLEHTRNF